MMFGNFRDEIARKLLDQHMHDCEERARSVEKRQDQQDVNTAEMHRQNTSRFEHLNRRLDDQDVAAQNRFKGLIGTMIAIVGTVGSLAVSFIQMKH